MALKRCFIKTLLALIAVCAFIACTNPSDNTEGGTAGGGNTPSVPEVPAPGQIRIMITGDERVDPYKSYIDTAKNITWGAIKTQIEAKLTLKTEWQGGDYGAYAWKLGNEKGAALTDGHPFTEGTTVYAVTNYIKFRMNGTVLEGYDGAKPRGSIIIPDTVTEIASRAFWHCTDLTGTLVFPRGLKEIKSAVSGGAFQNCIRLTGLDFSACTELTEIGYYAFDNCSGLTGSLNLSACTKLTKIGGSAFRGCNFSGEFKLPANITEIGEYAFYGCKGFTGSLDLSACTQLTKIESYAFSGCKGFTGALKLPANITKIDNMAFRNCSGFTGELKLPVSLTGIGSDAFSGCTQAEVKLSESIQTIGNRAFGSAADLDFDIAESYCKKVKIPSGAQYKRIKALVTGCRYPEDRIESY